MSTNGFVVTLKISMNPNNSQEKLRAHVYIQGYVQGVGFRWFLHKKAEDLGATGFVRNLLDGRLEAVFEGSRAQVEEMIAYSRSGPDAAQVTDIDVVWEEHEGLWDELEITY